MWDEIASADCQHLVLLGDSFYYDVEGSSMEQVKSMKAHEFASWAFGRMKAQASQADFVRLVRSPQLTTHAIWDDHDFLWNDACGAQVAGQPAYAQLLAPTRAVYRMFLDGLTQKLQAGAIPDTLGAWSSDVPPPGYRTVALGHQVLLHLTDGRSYKKRGGKHALLGKEQFNAMQKNFEDSSAETVHLIASGVVFERAHSECWADCETEHQRLLELREQHRLVLLSGDVHENALNPYPNESHRYLYEATASGAAMLSKIVAGTERRNWGLLDIDDQRIKIQLLQSGSIQYQRTIDRASWTWK